MTYFRTCVFGCFSVILCSWGPRVPRSPRDPSRTFRKCKETKHRNTETGNRPNTHGKPNKLKRLHLNISKNLEHRILEDSRLHKQPMGVNLFAIVDMPKTKHLNQHFSTDDFINTFSARVGLFGHTPHPTSHHYQQLPRLLDIFTSNENQTNIQRNSIARQTNIRGKSTEI